jgi:predicted aspartyl protease
MTKLFSLLVFSLLSVSICSVGQNKSENTSLMSINGLASMDSSSLTFTNNYLPFIKVKIDNIEYNFIFDTGAELCILSKGIHKSLISTGDIRVTDFDGNVQQTQFYQTDLQIGNTSIENVRCVELDLESIFGNSCLKIDGVLGQNIIRKMNWHVDSERKMVFWSKSPFATDSAAIQLDVEYYGDLPLTKVSYDNLSFYVLMDTGFDGFLELNAKALKKSKKYKKSEKQYGEGMHQVTIGGVNTHKITLTTLDSVEIGSGYLTNVPTYISKGKPLLGSLVFKNHSITFNFSEDKILLKKYRDSAISIQNYGVSLTLNANKEVEIAFIWKESEAYEQGLRVGQIISKINNLDISQISKEDLCAIKAEVLQSERLELQFLHKGKSNSVALTRASL